MAFLRCPSLCKHFVHARARVTESLPGSIEPLVPLDSWWRRVPFVVDSLRDGWDGSSSPVHGSVVVERRQGVSESFATSDGALHRAITAADDHGCTRGCARGLCDEPDGQERVLAIDGTRAVRALREIGRWRRVPDLLGGVRRTRTEEKGSRNHARTIRRT